MNQPLTRTAVLTAALLLAACASTPSSEPTVDPPATASSNEAVVNSSGTTDSGPAVANPLADPNSLLATRTIYFDFDRAEIRPADREVVQAHARYLAEHPEAAVHLAGHADERGTREYNLALGERRAQSVRNVLVAGGASPDQITLTSYGEERPAVAGRDEVSWSQNRRAELSY